MASGAGGATLLAALAALWLPPLKPRLHLA